MKSKIIVWDRINRKRIPAWSYPDCDLLLIYNYKGEAIHGQFENRNTEKPLMLFFKTKGK